MAKVFFSYSHRDEALRDQLETHLALMKRQGLIESWHDRRIPAGAHLDTAISENLESADVILLLVSPDFIASDYCFSTEMTRALERDKEGSAHVIPVILRPCDWHSAPFGHLLAVPKDGKPVTQWPDTDLAFTDVAKQVRTVVSRLSGSRARAPAVASATQRAVSASSEAHAAPVAHGVSPRSSNLALKKDFSDRDRDQFLENGFEYIRRFFEGSLQALEERNPGVQGEIKRIDAHTFTARVYQNGKSIGDCVIRLDGVFRSRGISYAHNASTRQGSFNEMLTVEADEQSLYFKPMGMGSFGNVPSRLNEEGAAEYFWGLLKDSLR